MNTETKLWATMYEKLGKVDTSNPLNNAIIARTMSPGKYAERVKSIVPFLKNGDSVLEIGCGYGGLAKEILGKVYVSYTVVDNKEMLNQARNTLGNMAEYVNAGSVNTLRNKKFTMFISHYCLSETPQEYREYILKYIIKNCKSISVRDYPNSIVPSATMIAVGLEVLPAVVEKYIDKYFDVEKTPDELLRFHFIGTRKQRKRR